MQDCLARGASATSASRDPAKFVEGLDPKMSNFTRRDLFKSSTAASAILTEQSNAAVQSPQSTPSTSAARERLLFDFGWRFHLGHASDPAQDFGWGKSDDIFVKSGRKLIEALCGGARCFGDLRGSRSFA